MLVGWPWTGRSGPEVHEVDQRRDVVGVRLKPPKHPSIEYLQEFPLPCSGIAGSITQLRHAAEPTSGRSVAGYDLQNLSDQPFDSLNPGLGLLRHTYPLAVDHTPKHLASGALNTLDGRSYPYPTPIARRRTCMTGSAGAMALRSRSPREWGLRSGLPLVPPPRRRRRFPPEPAPCPAYRQSPQCNRVRDTAGW